MARRGAIAMDQRVRGGGVGHTTSVKVSELSFRYCNSGP